MTWCLGFGDWLLPLVYLALLIDYGATFFLRTRTHGRSPWLLACIGLHAVFVVLVAWHLGRPPLANTREILSLVALATAAVYAVAEWAGRDRRTGVFVMLLVFLFQYTSSILLSRTLEAAPAPAAEAAPVWTGLHVLPALVAYTALGFAFIYACLYLTAQRDLRQHRFGMFFDRLPPLDLLGRMAWYAVLVGFVFMTLTIVAAPLMLRSAEPGAAMTPKVLSKIIAGSAGWLICAAAVLGRLVGKWSAARISVIAIAGFLVVMALLTASGLLS
jgi:ABC-type uncharacterized transport system permease subunit